MLKIEKFAGFLGIAKMGARLLAGRRLRFSLGGSHSMIACGVRSSWPRYRPSLALYRSRRIERV